MAKAAITNAGGRFLALGKPAKTYELGTDQIVALVEFDGLEKALACVYQEALKVLGTGNVQRDIRVMEAPW